MSDEVLSLLCMAICISPAITVSICAAWRLLELNAREQDTRRYPRYGAAPAKKPEKHE